ncbi:MFS transporter [Embleya sp. NBC_00896]|uniref:MFS transporter n=1 Tax=Embleya sp. NBC_00896 TaxID=2975961 RepID=UPI00386ED958|nr:MFS transporter [Embleya sp. NBC_00896]
MTSTPASASASAPVPSDRATYRDVLANPRFRLLFGTRVLTVTADSLRILTLSTLIYATTGSPLLGAITFGIGFLPQLVGSLLLGSLSDRLRPRRLIVVGYALECGSTAVVAFVDLPVAVILGIVALVACATPIFQGASTRLVAETLSGDAYVLGRSLSSMSGSGAQLLGLACGGVAVGFLGARHALLPTAAAYFIAAAIVRLRLPDLDPPTSAAVAPAAAVPRALLRDSVAGNKALFADRRIRALLLAQWLPVGCAVGGESLIVPYTGSRGFPLGTAGALMACVPVGMLIGNLVVGRFLEPARRERLVAALVAVLGLPLLGFAIDPPWAACAGLLLVTGMGFAYGLGLQREFLDAVPETSRGQAFGLLSAGNFTFQGVGPTAFGAVAELADIGPAIALSGAATLAVAARLWLLRRRPAGVDGVVTGTREHAGSGADASGPADRGERPHEQRDGAEGRAEQAYGEPTGRRVQRDRGDGAAGTAEYTEAEKIE